MKKKVLFLISHPNLLKNLT